ncbi:MAG TPA: FMN-binding protein [Candidatus Saccharimonadia bacterium]|jgi:uncharacterized protein with FMN-binding domain|nr:FMN-binding protein [Candidatus Saccharimonadia bacterium]
MMKRAFLAILIAAAYGFYTVAQRGHEVAMESAPDSEPSPTGAVAAESTVTPSPTPTPTPAATPTPAPATPKPVSGWRDGTYTGPSVDAFYGPVQIQAVVSGGRLTKVTFLQYPTKEQHSREVSQESMPILREEAISAQSAEVDIVSGATDTSEAFARSLSSALGQARA